MLRIAFATMTTRTSRRDVTTMTMMRIRSHFSSSYLLLPAISAADIISASPEVVCEITEFSGILSFAGAFGGGCLGCTAMGAAGCSIAPPCIWHRGRLTVSETRPGGTTQTRHTDRQLSGQAGRQACSQTGRQPARKTEVQTETQRQRDRETDRDRLTD